MDECKPLIAGRYDVRVTITDAHTGETSVLYDAAEAAAAEATDVEQTTLLQLAEVEPGGYWSLPPRITECPMTQETRM